MTNLSRSPGLWLAGALAVLFGGSTGAEMPEKLVERLKGQTVMLSIRHGERVEHGAGTVLCQKDRHAYVLTAYHLFAVERPGGESRLRRPDRLEIRFYRDRVPVLLEERSNDERAVTFRETPGRDLVLLTFPLERDLKTTAQTLSWRSLVVLPYSGKVRGRTAVLAFGYRAHESWAVESGMALAAGGGFLHHSGRIDEGFAGGPLYTERGGLLGVVLGPVTGESEADGAWGKAVPVLDVLPAIAKWLPVDCSRHLEMKAEDTLAAVRGDEKGRSVRPGVTLYEHASYRGRYETFFDDDSNLRDNGIGNDRASSVEVAPGCSVTLYQHAGLRGESVTLDEESADLGATPVGNDAVSSLKVDCPPAPSGPEPAVSEASAPEEAGEKGVRGPFHSDEQTFHPDRLKEQTVMIRVTSEEEGSTEQGAGVVLCQEAGRTFVLTAGHVLAGKRLHGGKQALGPSGRIRIDFFHEGLPSVVGEARDVVTIHQVTDEDLALLSFPFARELELTAFLGPPPGTTTGHDGGGEPVVAVGFPTSSATTWATARGTLLAGGGESLRHSVPVESGFSGGPLFDASGALLGINVERIRGEAAGEALAVDRILPKIAPWLPDGCLRAREVRISGLLQDLQVGRRSAVPGVLSAEAEELAVVRRQDGGETVDFEMAEHSGPRKESTGVVKVGALEIEVADSRPLMTRKFRLVFRAGYLFYVNDRIVGAIDTSDDVVYLHPSMTGEARSAFLAAAAALLLPSEDREEE